MAGEELGVGAALDHATAVDHGDLEPLPESARPLSGSGTAPAQVSFTPAGDQLVVTERATQRIDLLCVFELSEPAEDAIVQLALQGYLAPLMEKNVGVLVLGCTHYPVYRELIAANAGLAAEVAVAYAAL